MARSTIDVDVVDVRGAGIADIARRAGRGSPLHHRHRAYVDVVTVAEIPDLWIEMIDEISDRAR